MSFQDTIDLEGSHQKDIASLEAEKTVPRSYSMTVSDARLTESDICVNINGRRRCKTGAEAWLTEQLSGRDDI